MGTASVKTLGRIVEMVNGEPDEKFPQPEAEASKDYAIVTCEFLRLGPAESLQRNSVRPHDASIDGGPPGEDDINSTVTKKWRLNPFVSNLSIFNEGIFGEPTRGGGAKGNCRTGSSGKRQRKAKVGLNTDGSGLVNILVEAEASKDYAIVTCEFLRLGPTESLQRNFVRPRDASIDGGPPGGDRALIWEKIGHFMVSGQPWLCIGDFNELTNPGEKLGGRVRGAGPFLRFQQFQSHCSLMDLSFNGPRFTWSNKQIGGCHIKERIDRSLYFKAVVSAACKKPVDADLRAINVLLVKLKSCEKILSDWSKEVFPNNSLLIREIKKQIRIAMMGATLMRRLRCWKSLRLSLMMFGVEKSSIGLKELVLIDEKVIGAYFEKFYADLFKSDGTRDLNSTLEYVERVVSEGDNSLFLLLITLEEVRFAVFELGDLKAPGPDGFSGIFYRHSWDDIKDSLFNMGIYFPKGDFLDARRGDRASWAWCSLLEGRDLLSKFLCRRIGGGQQTFFWHDPWVQGDLWNKIWSLRIVPKVKHFLWRACSNALPTKMSLWKSKCARDSLCLVCLKDDESTKHLLLGCELAKTVWFSSVLSVKLERVKIARVEDWCFYLFSDKAGLSEKDKALMVDEGLCLEENMTLTLQCFAGTCPRCGVVIRDFRGEVLDGHSYVIGFISSDFAEASAMRNGLEIVRDRGFDSVIGEADCANLVLAVNDVLSLGSQEKPIKLLIGWLVRLLRRSALWIRDLMPPFDGISIADEVALCLREWGIDNKIFSITLDNASYNDVMVTSLKLRLSINRTLLCDGASFQVCCCSHVLNLIVQAGLKLADETISKVRNSVKYLKKSISQATSVPQMTSASCSASNYLYETNDDSSDQDYEDFLNSRSSQFEKTELAQYLHEGNLAIRTEIDMLDYWKKASGQFPILTSMARDILAIPISMVASESTFGATMRFWKRMWKLPLILRYNVFLWRACLGIFPTVEALENMGMNIGEDCGMCNNESEDVFHTLVDCPELQVLWVMASFDYSSRVYRANILEWLVVEAVEWSEE
ncbi:putative AC transposase [Senna tora]|uniref:Putative AC transposase n=1 Tax=Senna tora TaxID=362788 RepID=A0A834THC7_9FABA|nr:putative AC transposase [Senna tora]